MQNFSKVVRKVIQRGRLAVVFRSSWQSQSWYPLLSRLKESEEEHYYKDQDILRTFKAPVFPMEQNPLKFFYTYVIFLQKTQHDLPRSYVSGGKIRSCLAEGSANEGKPGACWL